MSTIKKSKNVALCLLSLLTGLLLTSIGAYAQPSGRTVVVLSLDGFRADYLQHAHTPNIDSVGKVGISGCLRPCFPSLTFPNHYSMVTGLQPDHHGIVANNFLDPLLGEYKINNRRAVTNPGFYRGEPIWNTARRNGIKTASFFWVGSETAIGGHHPDHWFTYNETVPYTVRVDSVFRWLSLPDTVRPRLILWYSDQPDHAGHEYGTTDKRTLTTVQQMDSLVGYFLSCLRRHPLRDSVDFLLVSDHGMATYTSAGVIRLCDYIDARDFHLIVPGVPAILYPKPGKLNPALKALSKLKGAKAYRKEQLPGRLRYGSNTRIGEIVVIPDIGHYIVYKEKSEKQGGGAHGYDNANSEMLALFAAFGPDFRAGQKISSPIPNVTIYPLICRLLGITPAPNDADEHLSESLLFKQP